MNSFSRRGSAKDKEQILKAVKEEAGVRGVGGREQEVTKKLDAAFAVTSLEAPVQPTVEG